MKKALLTTLIVSVLSTATGLAVFDEDASEEFGSGDRVPSVAVGVAPVDHVATHPPGTKQRVKVRAASASTRSGAVYPTDELLHALAMCETGGTMDQRAYNPAGPYLSYFQWLQGTWWSVGGEGDPRDHPYEVQKELARTLILQAGWSQFPVCSRVIGAR